MLVLRGAIWPRKEAAVIGVKRNLVTTPAKPGSYQPLVARRSITCMQAEDFQHVKKRKNGGKNNGQTSAAEIGV